MTDIAYQRYGKSHVRLMRVNKRPDKHELVELSVEVLLEGTLFEASYLTGDNSKVVPTDTVKNTIYLLARQHDCLQIEDYALLTAKHFLNEYSHVSGVQIRVDQIVWDRLSVDNQPHHHAFTKSAPYVRFVKLHCTRDKLDLYSGIKDLFIIKTTKSGFTKFWRDKFTTLPESTDRMMRTNIFAQWEYRPDHLALAKKWIFDTSIPVFDRKDTKPYFVEDYNKIFDSIKTILLDTFAGPPKTGVYSESVQQTLFEMGTLALNKIPVLENVFISLPNLHCFTVDMSKFNIANDNEVFQPQEEPHGMIEAYVTRKGTSKTGFRLKAPSRL